MSLIRDNKAILSRIAKGIYNKNVIRLVCQKYDKGGMYVEIANICDSINVIFTLERRYRVCRREE